MGYIFIHSINNNLECLVISTYLREPQDLAVLDAVAQPGEEEHENIRVQNKNNL